MTKCPTCGSVDPERRFVRGTMAGLAISKDPWHGAHAPCPDPFHAATPRATKWYPRWLAEMLDAHAGLENGDPENGPTIESAILAGEIVERLRRT